jgi:hypothetical protein
VDSAFQVGSGGPLSGSTFGPQNVMESIDETSFNLSNNSSSNNKDIDVPSNVRRVKAWTRRVMEEGDTCKEALGMLLGMHQNKECSEESLQQFQMTMNDVSVYLS